jgi:lipopolysaccharide/colanic/teichoic acid biosynthesis glycosyltransferase
MAVRLDSEGPALFLQERVGKDGKVFRMAKFRTMHADAGEDLHHNHLSELEADAERLKMQHDPRITRVGALLRKASLDELPNLWNVVKGDMSLVGPRPLIPLEAELLADPRRNAAKPGVTGYAPVHGRDAISPEDRNRYDLEYLEIRSFVLDVKILLETIPAVFRDLGK